eukprot:1955176-Alexandrium_andersonii.AAC.1
MPVFTRCLSFDVAQPGLPSEERESARGCSKSPLNFWRGRLDNSTLGQQRAEPLRTALNAARPLC